METPVHFKSESECETRGKAQSSKGGPQGAAYIVTALKLKKMLFSLILLETEVYASHQTMNTRLQKDPPSQFVTTVNVFFSLCN